MSPPDGMILSEVPGDGTLSSPSRSSFRTASKKLIPLQNDTCPKSDPAWPLTQLASASVVGVAPTGNRSLPLNPKSIVTTAFAGIAGTVGLHGRPGALRDHERVVDRQRPGSRVQDRGLDEGPQLGRVAHLAPRLAPASSRQCR